MSQRPPITCHVLDTTAGRPAASMRVTLSLVKPLGTNVFLTGMTNADGRVTSWTAEPGLSLEEVFSQASTEMVWALTFDTGNYFGEGNTFFPEVVLKFSVKDTKEHYHVPLLLSPYSYTTYRGS